MLRKIIFSIVIMSTSLLAMEDNFPDVQNTPYPSLINRNDTVLEKGLTLKQCHDYFYDRKKYRLWAVNDVLIVTGWSAIISTIFLGVPNYVLAGLYCDNQRGRDECWKNCQPPGCKCWTLYSTTLDDPICKPCLALSLLSAVPPFAAACCIPITKFQNWCAHALNERIKNYLIQYFHKGRSLDEKLNEYDMAWIGLFLVANKSNLLKELSPSQALALAPLDLKLFNGIVEELSEEAQIHANKLLRLLEMDNKKLAITLKKKSMIAFFKKNPILWSSLVRLLFREKVDPDVKASLLVSLEKISGFERNDPQYWNDALLDIAGGKSLTDFILDQGFILKKVLVTSEDQVPDEEVVLTANNGQQFRVSKTLLINVSGYFKAALEGPFGKSDNFSSLDPNHLKILFMVIDNQFTITLDNMRKVLKASLFFQMTSVLEYCDNFIFEMGIENDILKQVIKYEKNDSDENGSDFSIRWKFCRKYSLIKNQHKLATLLLENLKDLDIDDLFYLRDLKLILTTDITNAMASFDVAAFNEKLKNPKFLGWLWPNTYEIPFLRNAIIDFCADARNSYVVESAFAVIPVALKKGIKAINN